MRTQFAVLGDIEAHVDGTPVDLGHLRQRSVLAALLVDANHTVSIDRLGDRVWGDRPPQRWRPTLYSYISRLRQALEPASDGEVRIRREPSGYQLAAGTSAVDLHRFRALVERARSTQDDDHAAALLEEALRLWRGPAFSTLETPWFAALRETLHHERFNAELDRNDIALRHGRHAHILADLTAHAAAHPLDERLAGQLMAALHQCGRPASSDCCRSAGSPVRPCPPRHARRRSRRRRKRRSPCPPRCLFDGSHLAGRGVGKACGELECAGRHRYRGLGGTEPHTAA
ncbi:BTAD domain-containing putative transcriptional regulator [Streptomyces sp. NPDC018584]|uniref:AfsR/SARP family transcriptional regulator n=1 Tax=unclassified Streptomyces TaxID=2593676 RepID=UPI0037BDC1AA